MKLSLQIMDQSLKIYPLSKYENKTVIGFIHGHNSSASLIIDGVIKESISEEDLIELKIVQIFQFKVLITL